LNVTPPEGRVAVPAPVGGVTVAVNVTDWFTFAVGLDELTEVCAVTFVTLCVIWVEFAV
jgi:hypothetical protein